MGFNVTYSKILAKSLNLGWKLAEQSECSHFSIKLLSYYSNRCCDRSWQVLNTRSVSPSFILKRNMSTDVGNAQTCRVAAIQMTATNDKANNIKICNNLIQHAVTHNQAKMIFLPECFDFIGIDREETQALSESLEGPVITNYKEIAKNLGVWLSLGGFHRRLNNSEPSKISNSHIIIDCNGDIVAIYDKVHLFDVSLPEKNIELKESNTVQAGSSIVKPIQTPAGKIGLSICYDIRFPELSVGLRHAGAEILTYPSAFTTHTGLAHWETLLRARAIENQCYVIAAAQIGRHNPKRSSYGHSMIINPWGTVLAHATSSEQLIFADIDLTSLEQIRKEMPVHVHKRTDVYSSSDPAKSFSLSIPPDEVGDELYDFGQVQVKKKFVFLQSTYCYATVNKKCILPGHVLVISKRKVDRLKDLSETEITDLFRLVQKVNLIMEFVHGTVAANVACQDGAAAGQSIAHVHIHVLPRRPGDFERNDQVYEELEKLGRPHPPDDDPPKWRTEEEMQEEAESLRRVVMQQFSSFVE